MGRGWRSEYSAVLGTNELHSRLGLPSWMAFTRAAGNNSFQTGPAVDGTTFISLNAGVNVPRFDYDPQSGRRMLLVEPARTNEWPYANFADAGPNGIPDGAEWATNAGVALVDFDTLAGGPHGGRVWRALDTAVANRGGYYAKTFANATYAYSIWTRRSAAGAASIYTSFRAGSLSMAIDATAHDWMRELDAFPLDGAASAAYLEVTGDPAGVVSLCMGQLEQGDSPSSWIPATTVANVTRAAELCALDATVVGQLSGYVGFLWRPDYASTAALSAVHTLFEWAPNWRLDYDPADDSLKVIVNGVAEATSAPLTFARQSVHRVSVAYGSGGQTLTVDGVAVTDATSWGNPGALSPFLGSRAASANCRPAAYGDLLLAA